ncbi:DoxX family protein [Pedobacter sp. FW305-3-2-15-E-R2A2]|uniref:DoxX family protein n=1 Tax=Pedobacter sp. FW305-3-2-15-E-R2A2 TaxID=3140251 RepID=UPI003140BCD3
MKNYNQLPQLYLRIAVGIGFIIPVLDRLGWLGPAGSKNIGWGNWDNFVAYTNTLLPFLGRPAANVMGGVATLAEILFGIMLIIGLKTRVAALGSFLLTLSFALCMAVFLGFKAPLNYSVFAVSAACLLLSTIPGYKWSLDEYFSKGRATGHLL